MFVDGGESKTYGVDISIIYNVHSTPFTNVHGYSKFRRFFPISADNPLSSPVSFLLSPISCLLSPVSCLLPFVSCLLSPVFCFLSPIICLPSSVSCPCLLCHVSHAVSAADLIYNDIADLAILWSKFADLGNLAILTLLADLAD